MRNAQPLLTLWTPGSDWNQADYQREFEQYKFRQRAIVDCSEGLLDADTLLDIIEATGLDPAAYVGEVVDEIELITSNG